MRTTDLSDLSDPRSSRHHLELTENYFHAIKVTVITAAIIYTNPTTPLCLPGTVLDFYLESFFDHGLFHLFLVVVILLSLLTIPQMEL